MDDSAFDEFGRYGDVSVKLSDDHVAVVEIQQSASTNSKAPQSLQQTVKMCAGSGPSTSDLPTNWPCALWVPCLGHVDVAGPLLGLVSCGRSGTSDVTS